MSVDSPNFEGLDRWAFASRRVEKPWGFELIWAEAEDYVGKILLVRAGQRTSEGNLVVTYRVGYAPIMDAVLQALADQSRRTVLEILRDHPATAGELADALPIARPGVSRHLRVLREAGLVDVRQEAQRRIYSLRPEALVEVDEWLEAYRALWQNRLDALHTEIARGKKAQK